MTTPIVIAGDPHGNFAPILRACSAQDPGTLFLVGDCELRVPLRHMLGSLFSLGWSVHWILGNKDTETDTVFDNLATDYPEGDIGGKVVEVAGCASPVWAGCSSRASGIRARTSRMPGSNRRATPRGTNSC